MAVKLPHAEMLIHGLITAMTEKTDFESKEVTGYRATVLGASGGAAQVNFPLDAALPFAPVMSQVVWVVVPGEYEVDKSKGMSVKFVREADETHLIGLQTVLEENRSKYPVKESAKS